MEFSSKIGIFLDADGVLWPDRGPGAILNGLIESTSQLTAFTKALGQRDLYIISIVTNQTFAARGAMGYLKFRGQVRNVFESLVDMNLIDEFEVCYHHPHAKNLLLRRRNCRCRKPAPGMITKIMNRRNLSPTNCFVIGDRITDIAAGKSAGIARAVLINNSRAFEINKSLSIMDDFLEFSLRSNLLDAASLLKKPADD
jgi:D-glycero-D-manno-heptose 1,7-bisphosphate phosphatase